MSSVALRSETTAPAPSEPYRVMVVDDSAVIRGLISRWLEVDKSISVVASASNGALALTQARRKKPEVVVLDIEMPEMDGMTALPQLIQIDPDVKVIMASTLTSRNAEISLQALSQGAADYIPKPSSNREAQASEEFQRELVEKVKALGAARRMRPATAPSRAPGEPAARKRAAAPTAPKGLFGDAKITLREASPLPPQILAIGSSTGGPKALFEVFGHLKDRLRLPILIVQHMPPMFTKILAQHLGRASGMTCHEGQDGEKIVGGRIYLAPGDYHMVVEQAPGGPVIRLNQEAQENFCRPAVDPLFRSVAEAYGGHALGLVLTGMGHDGRLGADRLVTAGGSMIAQDAESSVVWGMPGAVATAGLCCAVVPLDAVGPTVERMVMGRAR